MKMGGHGVIVAAAGKTEHYAAFPVHPIASVTGAGDSLAAGTLWALITQQQSTTPTTIDFKQTNLHSAVKFGLAAAKMSLESSAAINPKLQATALAQIIEKK